MKIKKFLEPDKGGKLETGQAVEGDRSEERAEFHKQFSANRPEVQLPPGTPGAEPDGSDPRPAPDKPVEPHKKPGSNVPKIIEDKRRAEQERDELKAKAEKFEKEEKPALDKKIADLEAKIAEGGHTNKELEVLTTKLADSEKLLGEREALVNENKNLRERLSFHDLQSDPDFIEAYIEPIKAHFAEAVESFAGDEQKMQQLRKALVANSSALGARTDAEKRQFEQERNNVLSTIAESLDSFSQGSFMTAINAYLLSTKKHQQALIKWEETSGEVRQKRLAENVKAKTQIFEEWGKSSKRVEATYDTAIEPELVEKIKELGLDPETEAKQNATLVNKIINGQGDMEATVDILHKGRVYPVIMAKVKAQAEIIKGLNETIKKLRGSKPHGDTRTVGGEQKQTREDWQKKFSASRFANGVPARDE